MLLFYNICMALYAMIIAAISPWNAKAKLWTKGRRNIFERMAKQISKDDRIVWMHVASLGEFEQGRPVLEQIRKHHPQYKILLTFFSPPVYAVRKHYAGAYHTFYLPTDTPRNV